MLTIDLILKLAGSGYRSEGSCFGVTDPSRLRPAFNSHERMPKKDESDDQEKGATVCIDTEEMMRHLRGE